MRSANRPMYPDEPGWRTSGPSRDAAHAMKGRVKQLRRDVLDLIERAPAGLTAEELTERLKRSRAAIQPRISELKNEGFVMASGERRRNSSGLTASVWVLTPRETYEVKR